MSLYHSMPSRSCFKLIRRSTHLKNVHTGQLITCKNRVVASVNGKDSKKLLQGLLTNDLELLDKIGTKSIYSMLLNSQGRILFDVFVTKQGDGAYLFDCNSNNVEDFVLHIKRYKLRSKVNISVVEGMNVLIMKEITTDNINAFVDPRLSMLGCRLFTYENGINVNSNDLQMLLQSRYKLGISEGNELVNGIPLEHNIALLNGVSFTKGCYIGQELLARTYYTGVIRKRVLPLLLSGSYSLNNGTSICNEAGKNVGKLLGVSGNNGIGLMRLKDSLKVGGNLFIKDSDILVNASKPEWWPEHIKI